MRLKRCVTLVPIMEDEITMQKQVDSKPAYKPNEEENTMFTDGVRNIRDNFMQTCGIHGINKLQGSSNTLTRCVWILLIFGCGVFLVIYLSNLLKYYYEYPTLTKVQVDRFSSLPFPAVTICNLSPFNKTKLLFLGDKAVNYITKYTLPLYDHFTEPINLTDPEYQKPFYSKPQTPDDLQGYGMDPNVMISECNFDGKSCGIPQTVMTDVGPCFTLNADGHFQTRYTGPSFNLDLRLFIDQDNYFFSFHEASGIKVLVHEPGHRPDISNEGFIVSSGYDASATINTFQYQNLPAPYKSSDRGYCVDTYSEKFRNPQKYYNYTHHSCIRECEVEYFKANLGCTVPNYLSDPPYCSMLQYPQFFSLFYKGQKKNPKDNCAVQCHVPCVVTVHDVKVSYGQYPSNFIAEKYVSNDSTIERFRDNHLRLHLYREQLTKTVYKQTPKYESFADVMGNVGGQMGLFLGASMLSLAEIIEFVVCILAYICRKIKGNMRNHTIGMT